MSLDRPSDLFLLVHPERRACDAAEWAQDETLVAHLDCEAFDRTVGAATRAACKGVAWKLCLLDEPGFDAMDEDLDSGAQPQLTCGVTATFFQIRPLPTAFTDAQARKALKGVTNVTVTIAGDRAAAGRIAVLLSDAGCEVTFAEHATLPLADTAARALQPAVPACA